MTLTDDAHALLLLCSHLGLPPAAKPGPLTLREWNPLARKLAASSLKTPAALLDATADELSDILDIPRDLAGRVVGLLGRRGSLAIELERLESLGIWVTTRADERYPARLKQRLRESAPAVLFGSGDAALIGRPGLAVVGSRAIDDAGRACAEAAGELCAACKLVVYSGGARGTDALAMRAALDAGGCSVGVLADSLERAIRDPVVREAVADGRLAVVSPYSPKAGFSVGAAMGRNKIIYALAEFALVVASDAKSGGTWAGATEALRAGWVLVFVRQVEDLPAGNRELLKLGGIPFPMPFPGRPNEFADWLADRSIPTPKDSLFA